MIQQVLNKQLLQDVLVSMEAQAQAFSGDDRRDGTDSPMDDLSGADRQELLEGIQSAKQFAFPVDASASGRRGEAEPLSPAERNTFIAFSPELANLQSAIEAYFLEQRPDVIESFQDGDDDRRSAPAPMAGSQLTIWDDYLSDRRLFGAFQPADIGWINSLFAMGVRKFRKRHEFVPRPVRQEPIRFPDEKVRMIVFGDWGSGVPRAQKLAKLIRLQLDDPNVAGWQKHVIHLGDVYYSGWEYEYKNRFLNDWPVNPEEKDHIGSFTLNGNHDMYSGGWAYYDYCLADPRFAAWQGSSSLFHLENNHWQLFGLDTSHADADLKGDQAAWVCGAARKGLKTMLLSHHQYCSAFESVSKPLVEKIQPVLAHLDVAAWLWGHEHRCMTYKDVPRIRFPRCIGHGGVPVYQTHFSGTAPAPGDWEFRDYITSGVEFWAKFGFTVLDFYNGKITVRYIDEDGVEDRQETIE